MAYTLVQRLAHSFMKDQEALNMIAPQGFAVAVSSVPYTMLAGRTNKSIYVGTVGTLQVTDLAGTQVSFTNFSGWLDLPVASIDAGTTASGIIVIYVDR